MSRRVREVNSTGSALVCKDDTRELAKRRRVGKTPLIRESSRKFPVSGSRGQFTSTRKSTRFPARPASARVSTDPIDSPTRGPVMIHSPT